MSEAPDEGYSRSIWWRLFWRGFWIVIFSSIGASQAVIHREAIFLFLMEPGAGRLSPFDGRLVYTELTGMFAATLKVVKYVSIFTALPYAVWAVLSLIKPLLPARFFWFMVRMIILSAVMYVAGVVVVYYAMLPIGIGFFLRFGGSVAEPVIDIGSYLHLVTALMFALGVVFQIPIVMYVSSKAGLVRYRHWKFFRWLVLPFGGFFALFLSPGVEPLTYWMVFGSIIGLYEVGMFLSWLQTPEEGNYLWLGTTRRRVIKVWNGIVWVVRRPVVVWRRVERKLVEHGLVWWW